MGTQQTPDRYILKTDGVNVYVTDSKLGAQMLLASISPLIKVEDAKEFVQFANLGAALTPQVDKPGAK